MFTVQLTSQFEGWLDDLDDRRAQVRIAARLRQAADIRRAKRMLGQLELD